MTVLGLGVKTWCALSLLFAFHSHRHPGAFSEDSWNMCVQTDQQIDQKKGMLVKWSGNQVFTRDLDFLVKDGLSL